MASSIDSSAHNKDQKSSTLHGAPEQQNIININTADAKLLETLPGIWPAFAKKIMQYRQKHNGFKNKSELLNIKGIGKKRLAKIKPFIKLGE
jgi:competence ComEA-like helix-hairpin-helix protein